MSCVFLVILFAGMCDVVTSSYSDNHVLVRNDRHLLQAPGKQLDELDKLDELDELDVFS